MADPSETSPLRRFDEAMSQLVEAFQQRPSASVVRRRARHAARMRAYRKRQTKGRMAVTIEIGAELIDLMVRTGWLQPRECHERDEIACALTAMMADAARHDKIS
jgi:hypothetical protein